MEFLRLMFVCLIPYCVVTNRHGGRIVGGDTVELGEYPFVVALGYINSKTGNGELCTGSILTSEWVLTAGHCVESLNVREYIVIAGVTNVQSAGQRRQVKTIVTPSKYKHEHGENLYEFIHDDISLVQVDFPFILNNFVQVIALSGHPPPYTGQRCEAVGFGRTIVPTEFMEELSHLDRSEITAQAGQLLRIENTPPVPCSWMPDASGHESYQICSWAGRLNVSHVNSGDSGGPLVCGGMQVGVCSLSDFVKKDGVYYVLQTHTSVNHFKEWIKHLVPDAIIIDY